MINDKWKHKEQKIIKTIKKFTTYKKWISFMQLSIEVGIEHQALTNHLDRLIKNNVITEFKGKNRSRLFCLIGHHDDVEYNEKFRIFTQNNLMSKEKAEEELSAIYKLGIDNLYHKY